MEELLSKVRCPKCRGLLARSLPSELACSSCKLAYPIVDNLPRLLVEEARTNEE